MGISSARIAERIATVFGLGRATQMPGTIGAVVGAVIVMIAGEIHPAVIAAAAAVAAVASSAYAASRGEDDPSDIIIDEVVGMWVCVAGLGVRYCVIAFFLFRLIGLLRPFPLSLLGRMPGGIGIMADDIACGAMTNLLLRAFSAYRSVLSAL